MVFIPSDLGYQGPGDQYTHKALTMINKEDPGEVVVHVNVSVDSPRYAVAYLLSVKPCITSHTVPIMIIALRLIGETMDLKLKFHVSSGAKASLG